MLLREASAPAPPVWRRSQQVPLPVSRTHVFLGIQRQNIFPSVCKPKPLGPLKQAGKQRALETVKLAVQSFASSDTSPLPQLESSAVDSSNPKKKKQRLTDEEIAARIAASRQRKASQPQFACPSCSKLLLSPRNIFKHVARCCPDLMEDPANWEQVRVRTRVYVCVSVLLGPWVCARTMHWQRSKQL